MNLDELVKKIADYLKDFDSTYPVHKNFQPGIGPFGEPQLIKLIEKFLNEIGHKAKTKKTPDLVIDKFWAIEFKIVQPFGDNGKEAENWSVNMLHPYGGNTSSLGDALKLQELPDYKNKIIFVIGYEHNPPKISLDPLIESFELIAQIILKMNLSNRIEEKRDNLVHPEHQILRCIAWQLLTAL